MRIHIYYNYFTVHSINNDNDNVNLFFVLQTIINNINSHSHYQVPLPPRVVDVLSAQGEKVVPASLHRLHQVARDLQKRGIPPGLEESESD